jgi:hypothetical protein
MARYTTLAQYTLRKVRIHFREIGYIYDVTVPGDLVAMHRKLHLFDIDIPGKFKFKVN